MDMNKTRSPLLSMYQKLNIWNSDSVIIVKDAIKLESEILLRIVKEWTGKSS